MEVQEKHAAKNDKKNTRTIDYAVTICNKPSYYIYLRFFLNKKSSLNSINTLDIRSHKLKIRTRVKMFCSSDITIT